MLEMCFVLLSLQERLLNKALRESILSSKRLSISNNDPRKRETLIPFSMALDAALDAASLH